MNRTKSQNLNVTRLILKSSLPNPLNAGVKSRVVVGDAPTTSEWSTILLPYIRGFTVCFISSNFESIKFWLGRCSALLQHRVILGRDITTPTLMKINLSPWTSTIMLPGGLQLSCSTKHKTSFYVLLK